MQALEAQDPRTVGAYRVLGRIGEGGMGRVYLARNAGGRSVALKFIHADMAAQPGFRERFRREADVVRRVGAPGTVPVVDTGLEERHPWYASEYVSGPSLQDSVDRFGPLPAESLWRLAADLAQTLEHVHGDRLVHRDLKPSNVLLSADGPRLIDFGIVHAALDAGLSAAGLTSTGARIGTPAYMSPEQAYGEKVTAATDVYSYGLTLAFAATGVQPHRGSLDPQLPGVVEELRNLIRHCLDPEPERRPDAGQLVAQARTRDATSDTWLPAQVVSLIARTSGQLLNLEARADTVMHGAEAGPGSTQPDAGGVFGPSGGDFHDAATRGPGVGPASPPPPSTPPPAPFPAQPSTPYSTPPGGAPYGGHAGFHGDAQQSTVDAWSSSYGQRQQPAAYGERPVSGPPPRGTAERHDGGPGLPGRPLLGLLWLVPAGFAALVKFPNVSALIDGAAVVVLISRAVLLYRRGGNDREYLAYWVGLGAAVVLALCISPGTPALMAILALLTLALIYAVPTAVSRFRGGGRPAGRA
ncbi:serine/threonine protein kinase [Streptomyces sp. NBC_00006]|uniref:serine/threonine-protein kinase n=1 Tax=Streptomyces sp. NBC_00006 TaxID=2975619 RepID=UPI002258A92A|nr:serine/threonine-protein kinase [Streptomyces sp. NBC_00006]MCX5532949.1 serine/threonine protein kinase [Streptomyces sp. NBC_00006]